MTDKSFETFKKVKGCIYTPKTKYGIEGFEINKCLGNFASKEVYGYFEMLKQYELGVMPFKGSFSEQPAKVIDVFNIIQQLRDEKRAKAEKQNRKK